MAPAEQQSEGQGQTQLQNSTLQDNGSKKNKPTLAQRFVLIHENVVALFHVTYSDKIYNPSTAKYHHGTDGGNISLRRK